MSDLLDRVPELRTGYLRRDLDGGCVVWSPVSVAPTALDPVATVMLDVIDGEASIGQLASEVHEEVGVPLDVARQQVERIVQLFDAAGLLVSPDQPSLSPDATATPEFFAAPPST